MSDTATVILCGGGIDHGDLPIGTQESNAMIPVNGRPVIAWILNDLVDKGIDRATVVAQCNDVSLHRFLERCYSKRLSITLVTLDQPGTIIQSLQRGLRESPASKSVRIILGDTLIADTFDSEADFLYTGVAETPGRWCLVAVDARDIIQDYIDKPPKVTGGLLALAGYYHLVNRSLLSKCIDSAIDADDRQLSAVLRRYGASRPMVSRIAQQWFDFGHIDNLADARRRLLTARSFNSLSVDAVRHTITKTSTHNEKLRDELNWYLSLPPDLAVLAPRIVSHSDTAEGVTLTQEFYGYPTLAELFAYGNLNLGTWQSILQRVLAIHDLFRGHPGQLTADDFDAMYVGKTDVRLRQLRNSSPYWESLLAQDTIESNGRRLCNLPQLLPLVRKFAARLATSAEPCVIHGDFCFSNILFDLNAQVVRLIDPRGAFGRKGIWGDPRYDLAKIRHSICGMYDLIVFDLFALSERDGTFEWETFGNTRGDLAGIFEEMLTQRKIDIREIAFIEGLLFASMLPLHAGRPQRQKMMYCRAVELLNDAMCPGGVPG